MPPVRCRLKALEVPRVIRALHDVFFNGSGAVFKPFVERFIEQAMLSFTSHLFSMVYAVFTSISASSTMLG